MLGISACSRLQVLGNTKYRLYWYRYSCKVHVHCTLYRYSQLYQYSRTPVFFATVQYSYSTVLHGARMYTVSASKYRYCIQDSIQVQVLGNTLKLGVGKLTVVQTAGVR